MKQILSLSLALGLALSAQAQPIKTATRLNPTTFEIIGEDGTRTTVDLYGDNIFRLFRDDKGGIVRNPEATPPAQILVDNPRQHISAVALEEEGNTYVIKTPKIKAAWDKTTGYLSVTDLVTDQVVLRQTGPLTYNADTNTLSIQLQEGDNEYFYGGGVQNGRFSHKGQRIEIVNQNSWTDGGVASPNPFYWSTAGYAIMWHTFAPGSYDFGAATPGTVTLSHDTDYLDLFVMVDESPVALLRDFYQLTGNPVLLPKFGFYEGHLNAYNRDYWAVDTTGTGILFEDGIRYKESQRDNGGVKESLNGEKGNYQFSARAVVDRYAAADMPLGWILPNDGYGAGYGQTETLDGNIQNLKEFGDYARSHGVEIGLWTQSDLHPKEGVSALLQRDIVKEVRDAGVRVLKTDVAWVGWGYSFGLNGVADVGEIMPYYGDYARPFIISLDGWAGTQRYAGIWSGDQTGGEWEYIRFHIPTYIGSGLSGNPNITSDMDGIFGGKQPIINIRDFQWKTFTPMQLNMDGWGSNPKYPQALGEPATSINRNYLKLKSELLPYAYTYAREAVEGLPLIRAIFLVDPNPYTLGTATRYEYLYGPDFLVAPVYQETKADAEGNDIRNGIYLPEGVWYDYFTGDRYDGGVVINGFEAPLWKLPVFVRGGAIIPMVNPNNNPSEINPGQRIIEFYPYGSSEMTIYDDDGLTQKYLLHDDASVTTHVSCSLSPLGVATINIAPAVGSYRGYEAEQSTELIINTSREPQSVAATIGGKKVKLVKATSLSELQSTPNSYYYNPAPELNRFSTPGSEAAKVSVTKNPQLLVNLAKTDVNQNAIEVVVKGVGLDIPNKYLAKTGSLAAPAIRIQPEAVGPYTLSPSWDEVENADYYELEHQGMLYTLVRDTTLLFDDLRPATDYTLQLRAVNADGPSEWTSLAVTTADNPLEFAIHGITGEATCEIQEGFEVDRLFDFAEKGDMFHTKYRRNALPFDLIIDLHSVNTLDKLQYLPRQDGGNGTILRGSVATSIDRQRWEEVDSFAWERNGDVKEFVFKQQPQARYLRISVTEGVGNYGSGREMYIFRVPGTSSWLQGDINADGKIDEADLMSYTNYTGLRRGDSDFEGYISGGDINGNGLIDAYDISVVATQLKSGVRFDESDSLKIGGQLVLNIEPTKAVNPGEEVVITVEGKDLCYVNGLSFALPYDQTAWELVSVEPLAVASMEDLTKDRLHTSGEKALYPTFVNLGNAKTLSGDVELMRITFKALKKGAFTAQPVDGMLVDKRLGTQAAF